MTAGDALRLIQIETKVFHVILFFIHDSDDELKIIGKAMQFT